MSSTAQVIVFAHGAGCAMDHPFMSFFAERLSAAGIVVVRFNFGYMAKMQQQHKRMPPDRMPLLVSCMQQALEPWRAHPLWLMGKSMGSRVALRLADACDARGVIALGFPFYPQGKPEKHRLADLALTAKPVHVFQGSADSLGNQPFVANAQLPPQVQVHWYQQACHDLLPAKRSGLPQTAYWEHICDEVISLVKSA